MGLSGATNLQEPFPLEMGLKIKSLESGEEVCRSYFLEL